MTTAIQAYELTKVGGALGARVDGLDLARPLSDETMDALRAALYEHCVLIFTGQGDLTAEQQVAFGRNWGELIAMPPAANVVEGHAELVQVRTEPNAVKPGSPSDWHSDWTFFERPPFVSILAAKIVPDAGGDTLWASQYAAYESLSPALQEVLHGLRAEHVRQKEAEPATWIHPVVRTIPETGRRALYVNSYYTSHFDGMTVEESKGLLHWLCQHATEPDFTFRHKWSVGDVAVWDNRTVQHYAIADYRAERELHRVTIVGEVPEFH